MQVWRPEAASEAVEKAKELVTGACSDAVVATGASEAKTAEIAEAKDVTTGMFAEACLAADGDAADTPVDFGFATEKTVAEQRLSGSGGRAASSL